MQTIIKWQTTMFKKADPEKCYAEISSIGDEVTPAQVVQKAESEDSELHKCFTWDDTEAASQWRLQEARQVMRQLIVITQPDPEEPEEKKEPVQIRLLMKNDNSYSSGYKQTLVMVRDEDEYQKLLNMAREELRVFKRKYSMLSELREILDLID